MWVLISRRLRLWVIATIAVPVIGWALGTAGRQLEHRRGQSRASRLLLSGSERLRRHRRR
ncbi:hypothetical protein GCM10009867_04560 [Pedococcus aerophilus]|uniref:Uncharacterized protein n=1 Tax=Pedococcus aerophilus TaxID=436356 RepID=A0ABN3UEG9_9MICO